MPVEIIKEFSPELKAAFDRLIPQLSTSTPAQSEAQIKAFLEQDGVYLFVFRSCLSAHPDAPANLLPGTAATSPAPVQRPLSPNPAGSKVPPSKVKGPITGMLTLVTFIIPTGQRAWIEDVVVDQNARGQGAGQALVEQAVHFATKLGVKSVDLTSRPARQAANRLYRRSGFVQRQTNIYRYSGQ